MKTYLNLLPFEYRSKALVRLRVLQWSLVWILCLVATAVVWWAKQSRCNRSLLAVATAERRYQPLEKLVHARKAMQNELRRLHAKGTILGQLLDERPLFTLMGVVSRSARECDGRLVVEEMTFARKESAGRNDRRQQKPATAAKPAPAAQPPGPWASVAFRGKALDNIAIATFAAALRDTGLFRRVELKSSLGNESPDKTEARSYLLECDI